MIFGEPVALLVTVTLPVTLPAVVGANFTVSVAEAVGLRTKGAVIPVAVTPAPLNAICEICTLLLPVLVMVTFCVAEEPVFTLPKLTVLVLNVRICVVATPVPLKAMVAGEPGALLVMLTVPLRVPAVVGANTALNVVLAPTAKVLGVTRPFTL